MARLASPYPQLLWVLHVSKSALMTDEKYWPIKSEILKSPLILWQLCDFFSRMKYVHLMKRHVPCTVFGVFLCSHTVRFFQHSLFGSVNGDLRYRVVLLNLSRTLTVIFLSEGLIFFLSRFWWPYNWNQQLFFAFFTLYTIAPLEMNVGLRNP